MNEVQARQGVAGERTRRWRPRGRAARGLVLPAPVFRRWQGDRGRLARWRRAWGVVGLLLALLPLAVLLPPVQRLVFPLRFRADLVQASRAAGIDPFLLAALVYHESGFRPQAVSDEGAVGLTQLLPSTARWVAEQSGAPGGEWHRPDRNLRAGAWYLGWLLRRFEGDPVLALAAYNGGPHTVDLWRAGGAQRSAGSAGRAPLGGRAASGPALRVEELPYPETRAFVALVLATRERYRRLYPDLAQGAGGK